MYEIETPALLLHLDVVERNVRSMADRARRLGVALRPHAKTHKCVQLGRLQLEHGAGGLTAATGVEAAGGGRAGGPDVTWAFPLAHGRVAARPPTPPAAGATRRAVDARAATTQGVPCAG